MTSLPPTHPYFPPAIQRKVVPTSTTTTAPSKGSLGTITILPVSSITPTPTPTSTPSNPVYNTPTEARCSPFITTYPNTFSYSSHPYKGSNCGYTTTSNSNSSSSSGHGHTGGRSKSHKPRHFSRSGGSFMSPQSSPLIHFNAANGDSPTSMSPYEQSPGRSGNIAIFTDLTQKLNRLSLSSPSKRIHPRKSSEDDDITSCHSSSSSTNTTTTSSSTSSDEDDDDDDDDSDDSDGDGDDMSINMCLSSSTSTGGTDNLTKSYDETIGEDDEDDDRTDEDDDVIDVEGVGNRVRGGNESVSKNCHSRSLSSEFGAQRPDPFSAKLPGSSYSPSSVSLSRWRTPKHKKMGRFSQSMDVLPQICTPKTRYLHETSPRLMEREPGLSLSSSSSSFSSFSSFSSSSSFSGGGGPMLFSRSTILLPPSPRLFREEARNTVTLTPAHELPGCEDAEDDPEEEAECGVCRGKWEQHGDPTRYAEPDREHVLEWSNEDKGVFTSADCAYEVLKRYYAGDRSRFQEVLVLDCRYEYEYNGGHIRGAVSVAPPDVVGKAHELLFKKYPRLGERTSDVCMVKESSSLLILVYCEFSSQRGPLMYSIIKAMDRSFFKYPWVKYRNLFLIKGGYERFFNRHPDMCSPCGYVEMRRETYAEELRRCEELYEVEKQAIAKQLECFKSYSLSNANAVEVSCSPDRFL